MLIDERIHKEMTKKKEFKHSLLIVIAVVVIILAALVFLNKPVETVTDADHFLVLNGFELSDFFRTYQIAAVVRFMNNIYTQETVAEEMKSIFALGNGSGKTTDEKFIADLNVKLDNDLVKEASEKMIGNYNESMKNIHSAAEQDAFKSELFQRLRGFLVEFNKERLRLGSE